MEHPDYAKFSETFFALVEQVEHVVITSHYSPDDDSIGSVLAMYTILHAAFPTKDIRIVYTGNPVERYSVFPRFEKIQFVPDVANELSNTDLLIVLDGSQYHRFSKMPDVLAKVPQTVAIDHHAGVPDQFTLSLVIPGMSSNCEILYRAFDMDHGLTPDLAQYLLLGILGDTGNFSHISPEQADVLVVAKKLLTTVGMTIDSFRARYGGIPKRIIPLLQELVKNTAYKEINGWPDLQYSYIDRSLLVKGNYTDEDMSAASHIYMGQYLPRVIGYAWGFVITPRVDGSARMSSRSLGTSVNVRDIHERLGIGSGHDRAAGGSFEKETVDREPKQCIVEVLAWMEHNTPTIGK